VGGGEERGGGSFPYLDMFHLFNSRLQISGVAFLFHLYRGSGTGVNYPKWGTNENLGGNEGSINI
jgi:hypothetical protein